MRNLFVRSAPCRTAGLAGLHANFLALQILTETGYRVILGIGQEPKRNQVAITPLIRNYGFQL